MKLPCGPGQLSRYDDSLRSRRSGDRMPVWLGGGGDIPHSSIPALGTTQLRIQSVPGLSRGKIGRGLALTTHKYLAPRLKKVQSYISTPLWAWWPVKFTLPS